MLLDIFYKVRYEGSLISSFAASSVTIQALYGFAHICLPAHLSTCVFDEQKKVFISPEPISQNMLSSSSSYQHTKPWHSYVSSEKKKQARRFA